MMRLVDLIKKTIVYLIIVPIVFIYVTGITIWYWIIGKEIPKVK